MSHATEVDPAGPSRLPLLLIVDDDPEIRHLYSMLLRKHFRLILAADGQAGLARAMEDRPDVILTDQNMPTCTGLEMVERIRQIPALQHVPIIVSSAYMNPQLEKEFAVLGIEHFLDKPCRGQELVNLLSAEKTKAGATVRAPRPEAPSDKLGPDGLSGAGPRNLISGYHTNALAQTESENGPFDTSSRQSSR